MSEKGRLCRYVPTPGDGYCQSLAVYDGLCSEHYVFAKPGVLARPPDDVNAPPHYRSGGLEVIDVVEAFDCNFRLGNVVKYILRAGRKDPAKRKQDLEKAAWYLAREIAKS